jgi:Rad3-related DNA helicase
MIQVMQIRLLKPHGNFKEFLEDSYVTFKKIDKDLYINVVTTNLSKKFQELVNKSEVLIFMSGTLHSKNILKKVFGIENFKIVEAETAFLGVVEIERTGKEIDCKFSNFKSGLHSRQDYLKALSKSMERAKKPVLVHVNAYDDLPSQEEIGKHGLFNLMSKETLKDLQYNDKNGELIVKFKEKRTDCLFSTKCSRGVDFPGDTCNTIIFTKYPNPNMNDIFWKLLKQQHPQYFWEFYFDKAKREFLQRIYRALRFKNDYVKVISPDLRVILAVMKMQRGEDF